MAGSLGDLGTLLPLAFGMILLNGLDSTAVFFCIGWFYILSGLYFRITVPVQPMKVIGAYAIASAASPEQISISALWISGLLLLLAITGLITLVGKIVPKSTIRGVQLVTGILLFTQGVKLILGETNLPVGPGSVEYLLTTTYLGPVSLGVILGLAAVVLIFVLLENRMVPAALVVVIGGSMAGVLLGGWRNLDGIHFGLYLPQPLFSGWPGASEIVIGLTALALPQIPMTIGNAVVAQTDLTREYFGPDLSKRCTPRALAISMGLMNIMTGFLGGMPLCHGAGGLAAHYRFGARTAGSNLIIGAIFLAVATMFGDMAIGIFKLLPFSILGALLCFAGVQLAMMIMDVKERLDLFVVIVMLGVSLATNLAVGFGIGIVVAYLFKYTKLKALHL